MKRILLLLGVISCLQACQADDAQVVNNTTTDPVAIPFENVFKFEYAYTDEATGIHVINDEASWNDFAEGINSPFGIDPETGETISQILSAEIDFSAYTVIAAIDERHSHGGFNITINSINQQENEIIVDVETTLPGDENVTAAETQPIHIVKIAKTTLPVTVE
jgi:hypothetical protein